MENDKHCLHPYKSEELDRKLKEFNLTRNPNESDWNFRKRAFLPIFKIDRELAFIFLMGAPRREWSDVDVLLYAALANALFNNPKFKSDEAIQRVINGIPHDPVATREKRDAPLSPHSYNKNN